MVYHSRAQHSLTLACFVTARTHKVTATCTLIHTHTVWHKSLAWHWHLCNANRAHSEISAALPSAVPHFAAPNEWQPCTLRPQQTTARFGACQLIQRLTLLLLLHWRLSKHVTVGQKPSLAVFNRWLQDGWIALFFKLALYMLISTY